MNKKKEKPKDRFSRMQIFWTLQRVRIEHRLMMLGDRVEYSNEFRKEAVTLNTSFKP